MTKVEDGRTLLFISSDTVKVDNRVFLIHQHIPHFTQCLACITKCPVFIRGKNKSVQNPSYIMSTASSTWPDNLLCSRSTSHSGKEPCPKPVMT